MNKNIIYIFLIFSLLAFSFAFSSGCGRYASQFSPVTIISRYPALNATGIGSHEDIWIKFSKEMDTASFEVQHLGSKFISAEDMTATATFYPDPAPTTMWYENNTKLVLSNFFFIASPGDRVHYKASLEAFIESNNNSKIMENAELWDYTLSGLYIVSRDPAIGSSEPNVTRLITVVFNNPVVTSEFAADFGPDHTAGVPGSLDIYWSNNNMTMTSEVLWPTDPSVVDITYEAVDLYGNAVMNGQLLRYDLQ